MDSWVYIFSKFTDEALLFEALILFIGIAGYAAYFITHRRKYGVAGEEVPSNLVKLYLSQLVSETESMRIELFGLLGRATEDGKPRSILKKTLTSFTTPGADPATAGGPDSALKLVELEMKMAEQAKALDSVLNEKMRLEEELAMAKAASPADVASPAGVGEDAAAHEKIKTLEAQLAEYAIIEDDLANLKRLQKENKTLRQQVETLAGTGGAPAADAAPKADANPKTDSAPRAEAIPRAETAATPTAPIAAAPPQPAAAPYLAAVPGPSPSAVAESPSAVSPASKMPDPKPSPAGPEISMAPAPAERTIAAEAPGIPLDPDGLAGEMAAAAAQGVRIDGGADPTPPSFDALVDDVEKSLSSEPASLAAATPETKADEKSEEQLQADFEKMLNS